MKRIYNAAIIALFAFCGFYLVGCDDKFLDPTEVGRYRPVPAVSVILDTLGVAEETPSGWIDAEDPRPSDLTFYETDYTFGPGDIVRVNIFELIQEGMPWWEDYTVTETGNISLPAEVGIINVVGLTETQLQDEIKRILSPRILKDPIVSVTLLGSQKYYYSISGEGIAGSGRNSFPRTNFRLSDAIAVAGGVGQFNVPYIYVTRQVTGNEVASQPQEPAMAEPEVQPEKPLTTPRDELLEIIAPRAEIQSSANRLVIVSAEMATEDEIAQKNRELTDVAMPEVLADKKDNNIESEDNWVFDKASGKWVEVKAPQPKSETKSEDLMPEIEEPKIQEQAESEPSTREMIQEPITEQTGRIEWIFQDGKWVPVEVGNQETPETITKPEQGKIDQPLEQSLPSKSEWDQIGSGGVQTRVIKIPRDGLYGGNPRFDIAIRPGDKIYVPRGIVGEFYVDGHVNSRGVIGLTGRPMTLKMAIAAAGGLGPLAWPKRCEVIRRIGENREEIVMVDLDKIASGEQPDFFIKPHDQIRVGTHSTSRMRAVLRNAFRATYGFGFLYDRNFSNRDFGLKDPLGPFLIP